MFGVSSKAASGMAAAKIAAIVGKVQRNRPTTDEELLLLKTGGESAAKAFAMLHGRLSYAEFRSQAGVCDLMYTWALTHGLLGSEGNVLETLSEELGMLAQRNEIDMEQLDLLHDTFARIADEINASFTSAGERLTVFA